MADKIKLKQQVEIDFEALFDVNKVKQAVPKALNQVKEALQPLAVSARVDVPADVHVKTKVHKGKAPKASDLVDPISSTHLRPEITYDPVVRVNSHSMQAAAKELENRMTGPAFDNLDKWHKESIRSVYETASHAAKVQDLYQPSPHIAKLHDDIINKRAIYSKQTTEDQAALKSHTAMLENKLAIVQRINTEMLSPKSSVNASHKQDEVHRLRKELDEAKDKIAPRLENVRKSERNPVSGQFETAGDIRAELTPHVVALRNARRELSELNRSGAVVITDTYKVMANNISSDLVAFKKAASPASEAAHAKAAAALAEAKSIKVKGTLKDADKLTAEVDKIKPALQGLKSLGKADKQYLSTTQLADIEKHTARLSAGNTGYAEKLSNLAAGAKKQKIEGKEYLITNAAFEQGKGRRAIQAYKQEQAEITRSKNKSEAGLEAQMSADRAKLFNEHERSVKRGEALDAANTPFTRTMPHTERIDLGNYHRDGRRRGEDAQVTNAPGTQGHTDGINMANHHTAALNHLSESAKRATGFVAKIGHAFDTLTTYGATGSAIYAVANAFKAVVTSVIELEDEMKNIQAITSSSETDMAVIGASIKGIATTTAFSIKEIAGAVKTVAQAGVDMKDIPKTVQAIADVATATGSQLQTAADIITTVKEVWDGIDVSTIGDRVAQAANVSKLQVEDLKTILSLNAAAAKSANVSLEQSLSLDALLRNSGVKASTIATGSTQMMRELFSPDKKFSEFLSKQYGKVDEKVTADEASKRFSDYRSSENPLVEAISELKRIGVGDPESITALERSMDSRALNVFKPLLNSKDSLQGLEAQMRAGATASEGAAMASHTVKKAFENLGDQVEVLADAMGEPMLKPLRTFVEFVNKDMVKPLVENVEEEKLTREAVGRRKKRREAKNPNKTGTKDLGEFIDEFMPLVFDSEQFKDKNGVISDVSMKSLLPQQVKASEELNKKYEQYKNYSDAPDSLATYFKKNKDSFEGFNTRIEDTFGKGAKSKDDVQEIVKLLANINPKEGEDRAATVKSIQNMVGGTKTPLVSDISSIANEAAGIKASFTDMVKSYKVNYKTLADLKESGVGLTEAQTELLATLEGLRKDDKANKAIFGNSQLSLSEMSQLNTGVMGAMAPGVAKAKAALEANVIDSLVQQAESVGKTSDSTEQQAAMLTLQENISKAVEDGTAEDAIKIEKAILANVHKNTAGLSSENLALLDTNIKDTFANSIKLIYEALAGKTQNLAEQIASGIKNLEAIPENEKTDTDRRALKTLKSAQGAGATSPQLSELAKGNSTQADFASLAAENGISAEFASKILGIETGGLKDPNHAVSSAGATGKMQIMPATFAAVQKKFGLTGSIVDEKANAEAAFKYMVELTTPKGELIPGAVDKSKGQYGYKTARDVAGAYNMGPNGYRSYLAGNRGLPEETLNYQKNFGTGSELFDKKHDPKAPLISALAHGATTGKIKDEDGKLAFESKFEVWLKEQDAKISVKQLELSKLVNDAAKSMPLERDIKVLQDEKFAKKAAWIPEGDGVKSREYTAEQKKKKLAGTDSTDNDLAKQNNDVEFSKRMTQYERELNPNDFNINAPDIVALHTRRSDIAKESERLSLPENGGSIQNKDALVKLEQERITGVGSEYTKATDFLQNKKHYDANQLTTDNNIKAADIRKLKEQYDKDVLDSEKKINKLTTDSVLKSAQATLKAINVKLEANDTALKTAVTLGDKAGFEELRAEQEGILDKQSLATIAEIKARKDSTNQDELIAEAKSKATKDKNALKHAGDFKSMMDAKSQVEIGDPIEGYARKGRQEALGHTQYLPDQKAENKRDTASKQTELAGYQAELAKATPDTVNYKILEDEVNRLTSDLAKLNIVAEDLAPTLENQLNQISKSNIAAEINNLSGSLKNLDKNLTSRIVQGVDQFSTDVADSAVTATKSLLGFNVATQAAKDAMLNLMDKKGNAAIVGTNRAQLAMEVQSIRMNEADPVRQEMMIKQAMDSQKQAEDIAAFQVEEAQKAADKVKYDESLAGKTQKGVTDLVTGAATDVIKGEVMSLFTDAIGTEAKPMIVAFKGGASFPTGLGVDAPTTTAAPGMFSTMWNKVGGLFQDTPTEVASNFSNPEAGTSGWTDGMSQGDGASVSYGVMAPSAAEGGTALPNAIGGATSTGVEEGFTKVMEPTKGIFSDFTSKLEGANGVFLAGMGALFAMSAAAGSGKMSTFQKIQMGVGMLGSLASLGSSFAGMMKAPVTTGVTGATSIPGPGAPVFQVTKAAGGYITGPGTATSDSIPAMLSNGEYVLKASAVQHLGKDTLDKWNQVASTPIRRAAGGIVGSMKPAPMQQAQVQTAQAPAQAQSIRVVMVDDQRDVGNFISSPGGEKTLVDFVKRNSMSIKQILK